MYNKKSNARKIYLHIIVAVKISYTLPKEKVVKHFFNNY